ncbi:MAG: hypothetical protein IKY12_00605, partial [Clostridia bacterium]|nr:hypothetical protein [Clostridia bacterium]
MEYALENGMPYVEVLMDMVGGSTSHPDAYISLFYSKYSMIVETEAVPVTDFSHRTITHNIAKFGIGSVDPIDRTLSFECTDHEFQGNRLPVTIKHFYNSAVCDSENSIGYGWRLNLMQTLIKDGEKYVYTDEKGIPIDIILDSNNNRYKSADGELELTQCDLYSDFNYSTFTYDRSLTILNKDNNNYFFDINGKLIIIGDEYRNFIKISYNSSGDISTVEDTAGGIFNFSYTSGKLAEIYAPDTSKILFEYTSNNLSKIVYPDNTYALIYYQSKSNCPNSINIYDADGNMVSTYNYTFVCNRLVNINEYGYKNGIMHTGVQTNFGYSQNSNVATITVTEPESETEQTETTKTVLHFNDKGEVIEKFSYITSNDGSVVLNDSNGIQSSGSNLLSNGGFNTLSGWSVSKTENANILSAGNNGALYGDTHLHFSPGSTSDYDDVYQNVSSLPEGEYTFSCYANVLSVLTGSQYAGIFLRVVDSAGNTISESERITETGVENYSRLSCSFTLLNPDSVTVHILALGNGLVCIDAAQLENNAYPGVYNIIENGGFESGTNGWTVAGTYADYAPTASSEQKFSMSKSLKMPAELDVLCSASRSVDVKKSKNVNETFTLSGWAKGCTFPATQRTCDGTVTYFPPVFRMYAQTTYADGETVTHSVDFLPNQDDWQFAKVTFTNDL